MCAIAVTAVVVALGACAPSSQDPSPHPTTTATGEISQWRLEQRADTEALTTEWVEAPALFGPFSVTQGLAVSQPNVPTAEAADGRTASLTGGGGTIEEPEGRGEYYLVLPMVAIEADGAGVEATRQECSGRLFLEQVAECGGWVVRAVEVSASGDGAFEVLAVPEGFSRQAG